MEQFGCKSYWVMARIGVEAKMQIEGYDGKVSPYISNDYLGMSQRAEIKEAGIYRLQIWHRYKCSPSYWWVS